MVEIENQDMDDMKRLEIPTPFAIGPVNCYVFAEDSLTLLDPGPATTEAYQTLRGSLNEAGHDITDVEQILITHSHMDHFGLANRIVESCSPRVYAHANAAEVIVNPVEHFGREQIFYRPFLKSMGVPADTVETVVELPESFTDYQEPVTVTDELRDGERIDVGTTLQAVSTPGHSPGSICYRAEGTDVVFTGDHVLPDTTPNPLLTLVPGSTDQRTRSLPTYLDSLEKLPTSEATVGYGGHGDPIPDLDARIRQTLDHHEDRKERIGNIVEKMEQATAYEILQEVFPHLAVTEMFPGISEVIGHLDLLEDEDRVTTRERDGVIHYECLESA
jgi:glyoxylase-like metal-dependent hydrolase (beta-lactamase superfamily II)